MIQKQQAETPQTTNLETSKNPLKTKALVILATIAVGGLVAYEKISPKTNQTPDNGNTPPIEQVIPAAPESSNKDGGPQDINYQKPENNNQTHNKNNKEIQINNYDALIPDLPADRKKALDITLYNVVKNNLKTENFNINDATIRDGSVISEFDKSANIHTGSFIVDLPSIEQSYKATYIWSADKNNINAVGYTATIACLPTDKLVYGNFDCVDDFSHSKIKAERDPILNSLPYSTFNYSITADNDSGKIGLNIDIFLYLADTRDGGRDASIKQYESDALDWIKSKKLNPDDYTIKYTIK